MPSLYCHLPPPVRAKVLAAIPGSLKTDGYFLLECYTPEQIKNKTGGPPSPEPMYTKKILADALSSHLEVIRNEETEREVFEEVGLEIHNIRYVGSQAWPYPGQLMLGYIADAKTEDIKIDGVEIAEAHWFKYDQLPSVVAPPTIMAGRLIQLFVEESKARYD